MTPVISPWIFYLMSVVNKVNVICTICLIILVVLLAVKLLDYDCEKDSFRPSEERIKSLKQNIKTLAIWTFTCGLITTFVPTQSTITKMIIAQNVTYERVEAASDTVETVYNDIMALFEDNNSEGETE